MNDKNILKNCHQYAEILWNYHKLNQEIDKSDVILAFGSHDINVAKKAAELYLNGLSDLIIFTGGFGRITEGIWKTTEAEKFAETATKIGVPKENILIENRASNTGENIAFTKKLLSERSISHKNFIIVDKPYRERRTFATLKKQWLEIEFKITSPDYSYEDYLKFYSDKSLGISCHEFISIMVGDLQRIKLYSKLGFQIEQEIPDYVYKAYEKLVQLGFTEHLCK